MSELTGEELALTAAKAMDDKKAEEVQVLKMPNIMVDAEYFVISSCPTITQMQAVNQSVLEAMEDKEAQLLRQEGHSGNKWLLLDYGKVVVHIFLSEEREYYSLEKLWADAVKIPFDSDSV